MRAALPGEHARVPVRVRSWGDPTQSPGLVTRHDAGIFVVATRANRTPRSRLLTRPASALVDVSVSDPRRLHAVRASGQLPE